VTPRAGRARADRPPPRRLAPLAAACAAALAAACSTTGDRSPRVRGNDRVWALLERGKMLQDAGRWEESNRALELADRIIETLDESAVISFGEVGNETTALLTDDRSRDYVGTGYDRILLQTSLALNHAMLGELETAAVYVRRQLDRQEEARERNARQIAEAERRLEEEEAETEDATLSSVRGQDGYARQVRELSSWTSPAYADFVIPYGYYVGLVLLGAAGKFGEQVELAEAFAGVAPDNPHALAGDELGPLPDDVFVLFENGRAPVRVDRSFYYATDLGLTRVPIPDLAFRPDGRAAALVVSAGERSVRTTTVDSVERIAATEFTRSLLGIWFRAAAQVVVKEVLTKQGKDELGGLAVVLGSLAKAVVEPDLRSWRSLPAEHQIARIARPPLGTLTLSLEGPDGQPSGSRGVRLPETGPVLLYVRSTASNNLRVHVGSLAPPGPGAGERAPNPPLHRTPPR